jgi:hypothetical protein
VFPYGPPMKSRECGHRLARCDLLGFLVPILTDANGASGSAWLRSLERLSALVPIQRFVQRNRAHGAD